MAHTGKMGDAFKNPVKTLWEDSYAYAQMGLGPVKGSCAHGYAFHKVHQIS